jgi:hypothetical protein
LWGSRLPGACGQRGLVNGRTRGEGGNGPCPRLWSWPFPHLLQFPAHTPAATMSRRLCPLDRPNASEFPRSAIALSGRGTPSPPSQPHGPARLVVESAQFLGFSRSLIDPAKSPAWAARLSRWLDNGVDAQPHQPGTVARELALCRLAHQFIERQAKGGKRMVDRAPYVVAGRDLDVRGLPIPGHDRHRQPLSPCNWRSRDIQKP